MQRTKPIYGNAPQDLGLINLSPNECMFWLYCPIKLPFSPLAVPMNLRQYLPIITAVRDHIIDDTENNQWNRWTRSYVYITAKTLWVDQGAPGNRPGWHSDGFLTDDLNYIWYDMNPTQFWEPGFQVSFSADHKQSLTEMDNLCSASPICRKTYPNKHLLKLDQTNIHRVNPNPQPGFRTFVKVSVSDQIYALEHNSINHGLPEFSPTYEPRKEFRNNPAGYR